MTSRGWLALIDRYQWPLVVIGIMLAAPLYIRFFFWVVGVSLSAP